MSGKPPELYQGSDWFTSRWPVAEAFDALDRMRDLCLCRTGDGESASRAVEADVAPDLAALCDDLSAGLAAVEAEIVPLFRSRHFAQCWSAIELRLYAAAIKDRVTHPADGEPGSLFDHVLILIARVKESLKRIDQ